MLDEEMLSCWIETEISLSNKEVYRLEEKLQRLGFGKTIRKNSIFFSLPFYRWKLNSFNDCMQMIEKVKELDLKTFEVFIDSYEPSGYVKFIYTSNKLKKTYMRGNCHPIFEEWVQNLKGRLESGID